MKLFVDSANLKDIAEALKRGFVRGITTNPSLLAKEPKSAFEEHIEKIVALILYYQPGIHLSVEVFSREPNEILRQSVEFRRIFEYPDLSIKIQIGLDELEIINLLKKEGFSVNCTCLMTVNQAVMAAAAGARYVSLFVGRIRDGGIDIGGKFEKELKDGFEKKTFTEKDFDPFTVIKETRMLLDKSYPDVEIIAGSMRSCNDIKMSGLAGAHIVTVPPKYFADMAAHFKTNEVVAQFLKDFEDWIK
ncbi:MAG: hypothetical protein HYY55_04615 [Candidatus Niyogibacteria bacterium]|nr:MAG: hypothetical protein HYY55_04615 [Candidatus Niyogibacteria bacterium]